MYNRAIIIGRLTKEPELKQTTSGKSVCSFTVAVNRRYSRDETDFLDCVAWQKTAEFLCRYFHKGGAIGVEGAIQTRRYEDATLASPSGTSSASPNSQPLRPAGRSGRRTAVEIVADNVFFVGGKEKPSAEVEYSGPASPPYNTPASDYEEFDGAEDLPFSETGERWW